MSLEQDTQITEWDQDGQDVLKIKTKEICQLNSPQILPQNNALKWQEIENLNSFQCRLVQLASEEILWEDMVINQTSNATLSALKKKE